MSDEAFNPLCYAKRELVPLVDALVACAEAESSHDQVFYFTKIKHGIETAAGSDDLIEVFFNLSAANFVGFNYSREMATILDRLLERSQLLAESQNISDREIH